MILQKLTKTKMILITETLVIFPLSEWRSVLSVVPQGSVWGHSSLCCI